MTRSVRIALAASLVAAALALPGAASAQVGFDRSGFRLTSIGEKIAVGGRVVDSRRRPVAVASVRFRVADPTIATVNRDGVLTSRRVGYTKLWAVAGSDSASAIIVVDQWAAKYDFTPELVRLDAVGARTPLRILMRDAVGSIITDQTRRTSSCRSLNERVARLASNGEVTAVSNGVTWVRCADRGIKDSVRVEVRQRPARATIAEKAALSARLFAIGDTVRLQLRAQDRSGDEINDLQATWASLLPAVVSVDPLTGTARAVTPGEARIIAQAGDVVDTLRITVQAPAGYVGPIVSDSTPTAVEGPRTATLNLQSIFPLEGDETTIPIVVKDVAGADVPIGEVRLRSTDTTIVGILARGRIMAKKAGTAFVVGSYGTIVDSAQVTVRPRSSSRPVAAEETSASTFRRPTFNVDSLRRAYADTMESARRRIFDSSRVVGLRTSGRFINLSAVGGMTSHSFADSNDVVERRTGVMFGGMGAVAPFRWFQLGMAFRMGKLSSETGTGADIAVTEAEGTLTIPITSALALQGGAMLRATREGDKSTSDDFLALQQWTVVRGGILISNRFVGGAIGTTIGAFVLPGSNYTGYVDQDNNTIRPNPLSFAGEAGMNVRFGWFDAALSYYVESFTFPEQQGYVRRDQFSTLRLRLGLQAGR